jgi:hypothetical protein
MASLGYDSVPGPLRFQLVLLRRMQDFNPGLVDDALRRLGVPRPVMREANKRWQARLRAGGRQLPAGLRDYAGLLGPAEQVGERRLGDLVCTVHRWRVPLWDDLRFEAVAAPGGAALTAWLVRAPGEAGPRLRTLADLEPWGCTVAELAAAFPPAEPLQGSAGNRFGLAVADPEGRGCEAEFTWGLLQRWKVMEG